MNTDAGAGGDGPTDPPAPQNGLRRILQDRRHAYNFRWAEASARYPRLTADDAELFFLHDLAPLVEAADRTDHDRAEPVCDAAVEIGLNATGLRLLGAGASQPWVTQLWRAVLPALARHVIADPTGLLTALTNATAQFAAHPSARPGQWLRLMTALGPLADDVGQLRSVGQVAAWRSGLAHYGHAALATAEKLPEPLRDAVLELPEPRPFEEFLEEMRTDPWPTSQRPAGSGGSLAAIGAFRGFGGQFVSPPVLALSGDDLIARSGTDAWLVCADLFGSTLLRTDDPGEPVGIAARAPVELFGESAVVIGDRVVDLGDSAPITSLVHHDGAIVVTTANSHVIRFLALQGRP